MKSKGEIIVIVTALNALLLSVCIVWYLKTDRKAPVFSFQASGLVYQEGMPDEALLEGITAEDDRDGDVTEKIVIEKAVKNIEDHSMTVFYAVSDNAGNIVKTSRIFPVEEKEETGENANEVTGVDETGKASGANQKTEGQQTDKTKETQEITKEGEEKPQEEIKRPEEDQTEKDRISDQEKENLEKEEKRLQEEKERLEEEKKLLEEERKQLTEEKERLEEEKNRQETEKASADTGTEKRQPEKSPESGEKGGGEKPVLTLKAKEVNTTQGNPPAWVNLIQTLSDDKDSYETLFYSLSVSKYDVNKKGSYPVTVTVTDSDGNVSAPVSVTINVK